MAREHGMIEPFVDGQVREGVVSYGLSSYGYDIRVADEFKIFTNINNTVIDPKNFDPRSFVDVKSDVCIVPPNSFALARTIEYFRIPRDILTICLGKSTYARCGIIVNVTPLEPEISFSDDPLRMLRAARFIARFGLTPEPELLSAVEAMGERMSIVSAERIMDELCRLMVVPDPSERCTTTTAVSGSFTPGFSLAMAGSE